jgi:septation ring formation regulator EzrA
MNTTMTTDEKLDLILKEMQGMRDDIGELKTDVSALKTDVSALKVAQAGINKDINDMKGDIADIKTTLDTHIIECNKRMDGFETELGVMNNKLVEGRYIQHSFLTDGWTMPGIVNTAIAVVAAIGGYNLFSEKQKCE